MTAAPPPEVEDDEGEDGQLERIQTLTEKDNPDEVAAEYEEMAPAPWAEALARTGAPYLLLWENDDDDELLLTCAPHSCRASLIFVQLVGALLASRKAQCFHLDSFKALLVAIKAGRAEMFNPNGSAGEFQRAVGERCAAHVSDPFVTAIITAMEPDGTIHCWCSVEAVDAPFEWLLAYSICAELHSDQPLDRGALWARFPVKGDDEHEAKFNALFNEYEQLWR